MLNLAKQKYIFGILLFLGVFSAVLFSGAFARAQEIVPDQQTTVKAKVLEIIKTEIKDIPGTDTQTDLQTLKVEILEGEQKGQIVTVENDYLNLKKGEVFYLNRLTGAFDGKDIYSVSDPYRLPQLLFFIGLFVLCVIVFGGIQGLRGLLALVGSFLFIFYLLLPGILHGYSPILVSIGVSSLIIILGSYITHGFNKTTTSAVVGMIITIVLTGLLAYYAVHSTRLSGFETEEAVYLNFNTRGSIDFVGLLFGGIMIGLLGVLYDVAISQAIAVEELFKVGPHLPRKSIYKRALRMGREHIGALVNTLAIAYVGASLPLLLLFHFSTGGFGTTVNREIFSTEIIRTLIGSIGLILAVPITTALSVFMLIKKGEISPATASALEKEREQVEHFHTH